MRIIIVILFCLVLACKGQTMAANTEQSCLSSLQDDLLQSHKANEEFCTENNKLLRNHIELLTNSMEEMTINSCGRVYDQVQELLKKENEFQKLLESKNDQIRQLEESLTKLQMENQNYKSKEDSIAAVQEELKKQQVISEQLRKNLREKENTEEAQIEDQLSSEGAKLAECNTELESKKNALAKINEDKTRLQTELRKSIDKLKRVSTEKRNLASCIERDTSGVQKITLCTRYTFDVLCNADIAGPGWTVIQQRIKGGVNFKRSWSTYREGFGNFWDGDFFLGLEKIHRLTAERPHKLYIHMTRFDGSTYFAMYDQFAISGEEDNYSLRLGRFNGTTTDKLRYHNKMAFSTYDRDRDSLFFKSCAEIHVGGWWYHNCANSNLNGVYYSDEVNATNSIYWEYYTSLKQVRMMIRPLWD